MKIFSDRPSQAELENCELAAPCTPLQTPHASCPSHLQRRASSGQHGAYVKQGLPNHRRGTACHRDLASGNHPWSYPWNMRLAPGLG